MDIALTKAKDEYNFLEESTEFCEKILDLAQSYKRILAYLDLDEESDAPRPPKDTPAVIVD